MKITRTYIVIADGKYAKFYLNTGIGKGISLIDKFEHDIRDTKEIGKDKPGRTFDSKGEGRHSIEPKTDWHEQEKLNFAHDIANYLNNHTKEFDRFMLIAPVKIVAEVKKHLNSHTEPMLSGELHKDLTHMPTKDLPEHLGDIIVV
jgi:protein required for attachment to host cells